jgi:3',5'-cyclic AMP phosphodiesterase CpdA
MRLLAISDLHLNHAVNREALAALPAHPGDWLILAGDIGEKPEHLDSCLRLLAPRFARLIWLPGNHELWSAGGDGLRGEAKYRALVDIARAHGAVTPEDPYPVWTGPGGPVAICPLFLLYDYSLRPAGMPLSALRDWAAEGRALCADEMLLDPAPFPDRAAWCAARVAATAARLAALPAGMPTVLASHWPLHPALVYLPRIPRFAPWCGTLATQDWHRRFRAQVLVSGHLHFRRHSVLDGVQALEVSLGYPRQWNPARGMAAYLRQVLPVPEWRLP